MPSALRAKPDVAPDMGAHFFTGGVVAKSGLGIYWESQSRAVMGRAFIGKRPFVGAPLVGSDKSPAHERAGPFQVVGKSKYHFAVHLLVASPP
jgi:hypothetical protein